MYILPDEVVHSVRNCDIIKRHEHINLLLGYTGTQADLTTLNMLSFLKSPPTEAFKDYNKRQIELGAALLRQTLPPSPLFPPPAPSPPPTPFNFPHSVVTDPVTNPIPSSDPSISIPTPQ